MAGAAAVAGMAGMAGVALGVSRRRIVTCTAPGGVRARLYDEVAPASDGMVVWRTDWELSWDAAPGAVAYEVRTVTGEGASPRLALQGDRCLRLEVAAGEGPEADRTARRRLLLTMQQGQLAYQVRAVQRRGARSPWTRPYAAGTEA